MGLRNPNKQTNKILSLLCRAQCTAIHIDRIFSQRIHLFHGLSWFASVDWRVFQYSKIGHARRLGYFTREIRLKNEYLSQFLPDRKVLWMTLKQPFEIFINFPCLIAAEQYAYGSRGKINFWSHLGEERPENPQKIHMNPSRSRIDSIKSARKRSQKVTLITHPRNFLETLISCRNYIPKNAILQVNPSQTSLQFIRYFFQYSRGTQTVRLKLNNLIDGRALRFPQGKDPCGIPQGHRQFSLWDFFPQGTFVHFKDPCGIL